MCRPLRSLTMRCPRLVPQSEIKKNNDNGLFSVVSSDCEPCLEIKDPFLLPGWYMVELRVTSSTTAGNALILMDFGVDNSNVEAFLPYTNDRQTKRIIHLGRKCFKMRLYPVEGRKGPDIGFIVNHLRLVRLLPFYACELMLARLKARDAEFQGMDHKMIMGIIGSTTLLKKRYDQTFFRHLDHGFHGYNTWILNHEPLLNRNKNCVSKLKDNPPPSEGELCTVYIPVNRAQKKHFLRTLNSVTSQTRLPEEIFLVCNKDDQRFLDKSLRSFCENQNIRFIEAQHLLSQARGRFVVPVYPGDVLVPNALQQVAAACRRNPAACLIYSDHDHLDQQGRRVMPSFKPDWNPDLLLSHNYISGMVALDRKTFLLALHSGWDADIECNYGMLLACSAMISAQQVEHITQVLYHRSQNTASTYHVSALPDEPFSNQAGSHAASAAPGTNASTSQDYSRKFGMWLQHKKQQATVEPGPFPGTWRIRYALPDPPVVSIIIPTRDQAGYLEKCVTSILENTDYPGFEILIVDNQSRQKATLNLLDSYRKHPLIRVLTWNSPFNYSLINNHAADRAKGDILALLNNDIEVMHSGWLTEMVSHANRTDIGCVGAKLYYPDGTIQHGGVILGIMGVAGHSHRFYFGNNPGYEMRLSLVQNLSAVTGACLVVRKEVFQEVGGLETDLAVAYNDVDLCLKVHQAGYRNLWTPFARLYHHESKSRGTADTPKKKLLLQKEQDYIKEKWGHILYKDPGYNPNLTLQFEDFSLKNSTNEFGFTKFV